MPGLQMTEENKRTELSALIAEMKGYEHRASVATDDDDREKWQRRVGEVREQLRLRGHEGSPPQARAAKRTRPSEGIETR